jgi:HAD superfamily hydrolase (TIGR01509 family)
MIRAVIFDFNGILDDDEHLHFELIRDVLSEQGLSLSEEEYHATYLGFDDRGCFREALTASGRPAPDELVDGLIARKAGLYRERAAEGLRFFPGGAESVPALAERWPVAICSGALRAEIELALERMRIHHRICAVISAEDTERCKPDPEGYLLALDALRSIHGDDLEAGHCLVIEDSLAGVQSGKAAGMWVVGVTNTYTESELRSAGADAVISSLQGFDPDAVSRLFQPEVWP